MSPCFLKWYYIPSVDGETSLQRSKVRVLDRKSRVWTDSSGTAPVALRVPSKVFSRTIASEAVLRHGDHSRGLHHTGDRLVCL